MWVRIPAWPVAALVSLSKTLNHICFVLRMGRKAVGPVCCVMHAKEPRTLIVKEKGLAPVFLDSRLEHPAGWICARYKSSVLLLLYFVLRSTLRTLTQKQCFKFLHCVDIFCSQVHTSYVTQKHINTPTHRVGLCGPTIIVLLLSLFFRISLVRYTETKRNLWGYRFSIDEYPASGLLCDRTPPPPPHGCDYITSGHLQW